DDLRPACAPRCGSNNSSTAIGCVLPQWFAQCLSRGGEHDVEANANSFLLTQAGAYGVFEIGRKHQQGAVGQTHHDLVRIFAREIYDRRLDNVSLNPRIVKIYRFGTGMDANVVDATQEVIRMTVDLVH